MPSHAYCTAQAETCDFCGQAKLASHVCGTNTRPTAQAVAVDDAKRLDWLSGGVDRHVYQCLNGEWCAQDDVIGAWYGATPREALDTAIRCEALQAAMGGVK